MSYRDGGGGGGYGGGGGGYRGGPPGGGGGYGGGGGPREGGGGGYGGGGGGYGSGGGGYGGGGGGRGGGRDFGGGGRGGGRGGVSGGDMALPVDSALRDLSAAFAGINIKGQKVALPQPGRMPARALRSNAGGGGKAGKPVGVRANHFRMTLKATQAFHYDVAIDRLLSEEEVVKQAARKARGGNKPAGPDRGLPRPLVRRVLLALSLQEGWSKVGWASDWGKNIYAPTAFLGGQSDEPKLFSVRTQFKAPDGSDVDKTWKVKIQYAATVDLGALKAYMQGADMDEELPRSAIQVLEVVMRSGVSARENTLVIGSSVFFHVPNDSNLHMRLPGGVEAWAGYRQAVKPCQFGLSFNIDLAATAFLTSGPMVNVLASVLGMRDPRQLSEGLNPRAMRAVKDTVRGMRVAYRCPTGTVRNKLVREIGIRPASQTMFKLDDGREISVAQYYSVTYKITLSFPSLPPLNVSSQGGRKVWIPMELCDVVPGQRRRMLSEQQTTGMLQFAGLKPADRAGYLEDVVGRSDLGGFNEDPAVQSFGISLDTKMSAVDARVLNPPLLAYAKPEALTPGTRGSWNLRDVKFPAGSEITSWAFTTLVPPDFLVPSGETGTDTFLKDLVGMCNKTGIRCELPVKGPYDPRDTIEVRIRRAADFATQTFGVECQLVLVLLERKQTSGDSPYAMVKQAGDSIIGVRTQCFAADKAGIGRNARPPKGRLQYVANIAMKINAKMGGVNVKLLDDPRQPTSIPVVGHTPFMIFGADVTHPTSFNEADPSIAAVCASYDRTLGRFMTRVVRQGHRQEVIGALKEVVKQMCMEFFKRNGGKKPEAIIYYRDGVADSQFPIVLEHEYKAFRQAFAELGGDYQPPITFVVVQKRHNTRLFPATDRDGDRSGNCVPGTVVDTGICHPQQFDFYLNSHAGLQGHNKPAHYHVLVDENGFSADSLQLFTYWQCYLYCRCTRSVSYVPAAYYAHLAAFRGRLMKREQEEGSIISSGSGDRAPEVLQIPDAYANQVMFFA